MRPEPLPIKGGPDDGKMWKTITLNPASTPVEVAAVLGDSYNSKWVDEFLALFYARAPSSSEKVHR